MIRHSKDPSPPAAQGQDNVRPDDNSTATPSGDRVAKALARAGVASRREVERLIEAGRVARCHARDPSWFQWPLLEAVIEGNIVADFPLCNKSFNCSYSGQDL